MAASLVNIVLDVVFIAVFGWGRGRRGAGDGAQSGGQRGADAALHRRLGDAVARPPRKSCGCTATCSRPSAPSACPPPAQSAMYNISNMFIQSCMNSFGTDTIAAWGVYGKIDFVFWMTINSLGIAITTFVGQNFGARRCDRVRRRAGLHGDGGGRHAGHQRGILQRGRAAVPAVQSGRCGRCGGRGYDAC